MPNPLRVDSVVDLAYDEIRAMIVRGEVPPGGRLGQGELAQSLGVSRTPVREALVRLSADGLVDFQNNRGFFVSAGVSLTSVLRQLEVRLLLEPGIARLAAARRSDQDLKRLDAAIAAEEAASSAAEAHDASRAFHVALAEATQNLECVRALQSLWIVDIGRWLLNQRSTVATWQATDVAEHKRIARAVARKDGEAAERLTNRHIEEAIRHWSTTAAGVRPRTRRLESKG